MKATRVLTGALILVGAAVLCGCSSSSEKPSTAQEKKAFMGGPMPESARKEFEASMKASQEKIAAQNARRVGQPPAAPTGR